MIVTRPRCPVCGTRLNEGALDREIDLQDGNDILEQDIGGRGHVETLNTYDFDEEYAQAFLDKIEDAREYLREILGIEGDEN